MPNWTFNTLRVKGAKESLAQMMNAANRREDGTLVLSSWIPTPETFLKYDTTNYPNGERLRIGEKIDRFRDDSPIVTEKMIEEYKQATKEQQEKYGVVGWYEYNLATFGCKWDCQVEIESEKDDEIVMLIETPWSDPAKFICTMSEMFPDLSFRNYAEFETGEYVDYSFNKGEMTVDDEGEWREDEDYC